MDEEQRERALLAAEEEVRERRDAAGRLWRKVYVGSGTHLQNWLAQCQELAGAENVVVEAIDAAGLPCFEDEGLQRIWVLAGAGDDPARD